MVAQLLPEYYQEGIREIVKIYINLCNIYQIIKLRLYYLLKYRLNIAYITQTRETRSPLHLDTQKVLEGSRRFWKVLADLTEFYQTSQTPVGWTNVRSHRVNRPETPRRSVVTRPLHFTLQFATAALLGPRRCQKHQGGQKTVPE